jgi:Flp pilus assembly protein TadD
VLEEDKDNERAFYFRGIARAALGQYTAAIQDLTQSLSRNNDRGIAHLIRGLAYSELGQSKDAELDFNTAAAFSSSEMESFKNVFSVIDSPFKNTKKMLAEGSGPWKNLLSDRSAEMLRGLLD